MISYLFSSSFIIQFTFSNPCDDMPENSGIFSNPCDDMPENSGTFSNPCDDVPQKLGVFSNPYDDMAEKSDVFSNSCDGASLIFLPPFLWVNTLCEFPWVSSAQPNSSSNHRAKLSAADIVAYHQERD